jgi:hypothetical protein
MKAIRDIICLLAGLFILGVAGGLEKGLISIGGALLAWGISAMVISIVILIERSRTNDRT